MFWCTGICPATYVYNTRTAVRAPMNTPSWGHQHSDASSAGALFLLSLLLLLLARAAALHPAFTLPSPPLPANPQPDLHATRNMKYEIDLPWDDAARPGTN